MKFTLITKKSVGIFVSIILQMILINSVYSQNNEQFIMLNTEMHNNIIYRISTDEKGKLILTSSKDKTAKLWDAQQNILIRTFEIPIGKADDGMLHAGALSPNGKIVALGGWTQSANLYCVYIYNAFNGAMISKIDNLPDIIEDLEFSIDGKYLAIAFFGKNGVKVYQMPINPDDFTNSQPILINSFDDYESECFNIAWDNSNRLATACGDGIVRLYDSTFNLINKNSELAGKKPFSLAFSPDGKLLAVGFYDSYKIQVFDAETLKLLYEPGIAGIDNIQDRLNNVIFSSDGKNLIAGGFNKKYQTDGKWWRIIRVWTNAGKGDFKDYPASMNTITDLKTIGDNILFSGSYPDFGIISLTGSKILYNKALINDFSIQDKSFLKINYKGDEIGIIPTLGIPILFNLKSRKIILNDNTMDFSSLKPYTDNYRNIVITDWNQSFSPKINDKKVAFLDKNEECFSTDIAANSDKIIWGAKWNLYCTNDSGKVIWQKPTQTIAYCVNLSGNDKLVFAAMSDGIIQIFDANNGQLLFNFYISPNGKNWVIWTTTGYYDCSTGDDNLLGWHINQGNNKESSFIPMNQYLDKYYRPDIIDDIIIHNKLPEIKENK